MAFKLTARREISGEIIRQAEIDLVSELKDNIRKELFEELSRKARPDKTYVFKYGIREINGRSDYARPDSRSFEGELTADELEL